MKFWGFMNNICTSSRLYSPDAYSQAKSRSGNRIGKRWKMSLWPKSPTFTTILDLGVCKIACGICSTHLFNTAIAQLTVCFCPVTSFLKIGLSRLPSDSFLSNVYSQRVFYKGVPGFATDCLCGVWCRGLTTCFLYVIPLFGKLFSTTVDL